MEEKSKEQLLQEREKRLSDTIQLKIPDRVPIEMSFGYFPAKYTGVTSKPAYYDFDTWLEATKKTIVDFQPDALCHVQGISPGAAMEILELRSMRWPGYGLPDESGHQAIEGEWMKADEYEPYFNDRADYMLRTYLPRLSGAMEPLKDLPKLSELGYGFQGVMSLARALAQPGIAESIARLQRAGEELNNFSVKMLEFNKEIRELGFPMTGMGPGGAPFDVISDNIRGMTGAMLDMFRQPDKLMRAHDEILEKTLARIAALPQHTDNPRVFMALHRGSDGFMSLRQFEKYYWPGLKAVIAGDIKRLGRTAAGFVPLMVFLYIASSLYIVITNYELVPGIISAIIKSAFGLDPVTGTAAGITFREVLITGVKRAVYSNEAGVGTEALAHGAALTRQPVREGLVAMWGPFIDTHLICTLTALVILISGVGVQDTGVVMAANAFERFIPTVGKDLLFISISMFALSTMTTYSYYAVKCSRYLFGKRKGTHYLYCYLLFIPVASNWTQSMAVNIIDTMFALMVIPTLSATILLAPRVVEAMREYFARDWDKDRTE